MTTLSVEAVTAIKQAAAHMPTRQAALLFALRAVQAEAGQVGPDEVDAITELLGLPPIQVEGVARFYDLITRDRTQAHRFRLCEGVVCAMRGADAVHDAVTDALADGRLPSEALTYERAACLGHCDHAPAALSDGLLTGPLDPTLVIQMIADFLAGEGT
jgi:NADH-quinone oxidoreductase subunit E